MSESEVKSYNKKIKIKPKNKWNAQIKYFIQQIRFNSRLTNNIHAFLY